MTRRLAAALKSRLRQQARARCGYCLSSEALLGMSMEFEHLTPLAAGGRTVERGGPEEACQTEELQQVDVKPQSLLGKLREHTRGEARSVPAPSDGTITA